MIPPRCSAVRHMRTFSSAILVWCSGLPLCRSLRWQWKRTSTVLRPLHPQCTERPLAEDLHIHQGPLLSYPGSICGGSGNAVNSHSCCRHETTYDEMQLLTIQLTLAGQLHASSALLRAWWWKLQAHLRCVTPQVNLLRRWGFASFKRWVYSLSQWRRLHNSAVACSSTCSQCSCP